MKLLDKKTELLTLKKGDIVEIAIQPDTSVPAIDYQAFTEIDEEPIGEICALPRNTLEEILGNKITDITNPPSKKRIGLVIYHEPQNQLERPVVIIMREDERIRVTTYFRNRSGENEEGISVYHGKNTSAYRKYHARLRMIGL